MKKTVGLLLVLFCLNKSYSQVDTVFWFAVPEISESGGSQQMDRPIFLRISAFNTPAIVTISQPANSSFIPIQISIAANSTQSVNLSTWVDMLENKPANAVLKKGLKISSTALINAYYEVYGGQASAYNPEIFVLKGKNAFGNSFTIPSQNLVSNDNRYTPQPLNGFDIVAIENTTLTINLSKPANGRSANTPFTVNLNKGESFSVVADSYLASQHLSGSTVKSTGKVAITVKDDLMHGGGVFGGDCGDLGGDQIIPDEILGTEYIAIRGFLSSPGDEFFVTALENNTQINVNGTPFATINAFETLMIPFGSNDAIYVSSNKKIANMHLSGFGCETGLESLPPINCTGSKIVSVVRATSEPMFLMVSCKANAVSGFTVNGNSTILPASAFQTVPGTANQWKYARVSIDLATVPANGIGKIENSLGRFQLGIIHGTAEYTGCRYGYFSDFNSINVTASSSKVKACIGDTVFFDYNSSAFGVPQWAGPQNFNSNLDRPFKIIKTKNDSGFYRIRIADPECGIVEDSVHIGVDSIAVQSINDSEICLNDSIQLTTNAYNATLFNWSPSSGLNNGSLQNPKASPTTNTKYIIEAIGGGCKTYDTVTINVKPLPLLNVSNDTSVCIGLSSQLNVSGATSYVWQPSNFLDNAFISNPVAKPQNNITYKVTGTSANNCKATDSVAITVFAKTSPTISSDTSICGNGLVNLHAGGGTDYLWQPGSLIADSIASNTSASVFQTTKFNVRIINAKCLDTNYRQITITVNQVPNLTVSSSNDLDCSVRSTALNASGAANYLWIPAIGLSNNSIPNPIATPDSTITYQVIGISDKGCNDTAFVTVKTNFSNPTNNNFLPNAFTPNNDGLNDCFGILNNTNFKIQYFEIYNRWGQLIWSTKDSNSCWDGTYKGIKQPQGLYPYRIKASGSCGNIQKNGWVILIR